MSKFYIVSKTTIDKEYLYSNKHSILCKSEKEAEMLAEHLNKYKDKLIDDFILKDGEKYHVYQIDKYDTIPRYKLKNTKNKISIIKYYGDDFI